METDNDYFTLSPMTQRMRGLEPGRTYSGSIDLINPITATGDFYYKAYVAPYSVVDDEFGVDLTSESAYTQIANWITIEEPNGVVKPNEIKKVNFTVTVPDNTHGGGQYAAIVFARDPEAGASGEGNSNNVAVKDIYEMASLIYADVNGDIRHSGEILENNIPGFISSPPINLSVVVSNTGNIHEYATIIIEAKDVFTGNVIVEMKEAKDYYNEIIMPESTQTITRDIYEGLPQLGIVHVEQTVQYNGETSKEVKDVIICPIWFLVLMGIVLLSFITIVSYIVHKHKKRKQKRDKEKQII